MFIFQWIKLICIFLKSWFVPSTQLRLENLALRSQLAIYQQQQTNKKISKPRVNIVFRQLWVLLSRVLPKWKDTLVIVKPETVIGWHKTAFKFYWKKKSKKAGRPKISPETIALIKRIHDENPLLSPEKIHEKLVALNVIDAPAPNTIAKYIPESRKTPTDKQKQSWKTFLNNHGVWAMDFMVVPTITFKILYVLVIISHDRRKIEHFGVTSNPNSAWVCQQIREATPFGECPNYLIHDNDRLFTSKEFQVFLENTNIKSKKTSIKSPWQNAIAERCIGIFRQELLNHIIPVNQRHLHKLISEYVNKYYNVERTHQGIKYETPVASVIPIETKVKDTVLESQPILNGLYHSYKKAA
jgi:transposase InsO family protein